MGQCSLFRQPGAEKVGPQPAAGTAVVRRQEQQRKRKKAVAHMKKHPNRASGHEYLVLMVSLDAITKID